MRPTPRSRRDFLKAAGGAALGAASIPSVHAAGSDTLEVALIGCGGRGTGAAEDALATQAKHGTIRLTALADLFPAKVKRTQEQLKERFGTLVDVPPDRQFSGLSAYKGAMDALRPGHIAIFATPPAFRWVFFKYAVEKGLNVFLEKAVTVDGPTSRRMLELSKEADRKNLKVGVGLMVRHCRGRQELEKRIRGGEIGDIVAMRAYRMQGPGGNMFAGPRPASQSELLYQITRFHSFLWASGGAFVDYNIHQIDECCWMKGGWPVQAHAVGGRHFRGGAVDQNFDAYHIEYGFADGTKFFFDGRFMAGCHNEFASYVHGSKGSAIVSAAAHTPGKVATFEGHTLDVARRIWAYPQPEQNPYRLEWEDLVDAVKHDRPYNEVPRGVMASAVAGLGRMAAHTGQVVTLDQFLNSPHEFAPGIDALKDDSPAPVQAGPDGKYPIPEPGIKKDREY